MKNTITTEIDVEQFPIFDAHTHFTQAYLDQVIACYTRCGVTGGLVLHGTMDTRAVSFGEFLIELKQRNLLSH